MYVHVHVVSRYINSWKEQYYIHNVRAHVHVVSHLGKIGMYMCPYCKSFSTICVSSFVSNSQYLPIFVGTCTYTQYICCIYYIYIILCMYMQVHVHACMYIQDIHSMYVVCIYIYIILCMYMYIHVGTCICMYAHVGHTQYVCCMYLHIHNIMYVHVYTCRYMYMHVCTCRTYIVCMLYVFTYT